jgi:uncharacterized membrane protein YuzA (DUF378 family)
MRNKTLDWTVITLIVVGAINWGLVGFFQYDLVAALFGGMGNWISRIIYAVIGIAGLYGLTLYSKVDDAYVAEKRIRS